MPSGDAELGPELYLYSVTLRSRSCVAENSYLLGLIIQRRHSSESLILKMITLDYRNVGIYLPFDVA